MADAMRRDPTKEELIERAIEWQRKILRLASDSSHDQDR
jgi:hypothetical protein